MPSSHAVDKALSEILALSNTHAGKPGGPGRSGKNRRSGKPGDPNNPTRRFHPQRWIFSFLFFVLTPVVLLLRVSVWSYSELTLPIWMDVAIGAIAAMLVMYLGLWMLLRRFSFPKWKILSRIAAILVFVYTCFALLYVSVDNVKQPDIQETYLSLHPLLRLAVSTYVLIDSDAVITDTGRSLQDYTAMGLPANQNSLHFEQPDGYVHALDLRTIDRSSFRNQVSAFGFRMVGFHVLRHNGTADHLHISLPVHGSD